MGAPVKALARFYVGGSTATEPGQPIAVNPDQVCTAQEVEPGVCKLWFVGDGDPLPVEGTLDDVVVALAEAAKGKPVPPPRTPQKGPEEAKA